MQGEMKINPNLMVFALQENLNIHATKKVNTFAPLVLRDNKGLLTSLVKSSKYIKKNPKMMTTAIQLGALHDHYE